MFKSIIGPDPPTLAFEPLRPWEVRRMRASLESTEDSQQPRTTEGRAALANITQACRAALAEYEASPPLARLRRSRRRFDAMVEHRAQALEEANTEAGDWPPSVAAVQDVLEGLKQPELEPQDLTPLQAAVLGALPERGATSDEIAALLSIEYKRPPTRQTVIDAYKHRQNRTGGRSRTRGKKRRRPR